jgi:hypothetical protein
LGYGVVIERLGVLFAFVRMRTVSVVPGLLGSLVLRLVIVGMQMAMGMAMHQIAVPVLMLMDMTMRMFCHWHLHPA